VEIYINQWEKVVRLPPTKTNGENLSTCHLHNLMEKIAYQPQKSMGKVENKTYNT
jgi:hypothetical protein